VLLPEVNCLFGIPQPEKYHPEIDTGIHQLMALDLAAELGRGAANVVFAVLMHDLGKGITPQQEWPSHRGHESAGLPLVDEVCSRLKVPNAIHDLSRKVCLLHLRCHLMLEARPVSALRLLEKLDAFRQPEILPDFIAACEADYRGRKGLQDRPYPQGERLQRVYRVAAKIRARDLDLEGVSGPEVGKRLRQARVKAITNLL
jgi:tRNA nucleotidyltransferase (CCA-adding enzyme)